MKQNKEAAEELDSVVFGSAATDGMMRGAKKLFTAVSSTMGPKGKNVIIDNGVTAPLITKDGVTVARSINLKDRLESVGANLIKEVAAKTNEACGDGPQPMHAKVLTPTGWTTIGQLKTGDVICGTNGTLQHVLGIFPQGVQTVYKMHFGDGNKTTRVVECSENHLWSVVTYNGDEKCMTTGEIIKSGIRRSVGTKYFVRPTQIEFQSSELPLDPYLLGVLLGDGSLSENGRIEIAVGLGEEDVIDRLLLPEGCKVHKRFYRDKKHYIRATLSGTSPKDENGNRSIVKRHLRTLGLLGTNSHTKFIPANYLFSSLESRRKLLEGLIDTDGTISGRGLFELSTVSEKLCLDFVHLCRSLGLQIHVRKLERKAGDGSFSTKPIYRVTQLKGNKHGLALLDIEKTSQKTEMVCIKVSNEDHLYITNDFVPTHNTTTASVLAYNLLYSGLKMKASGRSTSDLQKGIEWATKVVIDDMVAGSVSVSGDREAVISVGQISSRDRKIGELIADAVEKVGPNGLITVEPAKSTKTTLEVTDGLEISNGYISPYFVTNQEKLTAEFNDCYVLVTTQKISSMKDILRVLEVVQQENKALLIIADDVEGEALHALIVNKTNKIIKVCAIRAPAFGDHRHELLSDIALVTGAKLIDSGYAKPLSSVGKNELGVCGKVVAGKTSTLLVSENRNDHVKERIASLESSLDHARKTPGVLSDEKYEQLKTRLAKLSGGVAVVKVGGSTEVELFEKKDRVEDALNATLAAVQEGIHGGGGTALCTNSFKLSTRLQELSKTRSDDFCAGVRVVIEACQAPLKTIVGNAGGSADLVLAKLLSEFNETGSTNAHSRFGFNANTGEFCDLIKSGVIDPVKVSRLALEYASSVAQLLLTTECVVFDRDNN